MRRLDIHHNSDLDDMVRGDGKEGTRQTGIAREKHEEVLAPQRHPRLRGGQRVNPTQKERGVPKRHDEALEAAHCQHGRDIRRLHEPMPECQAVDAGFKWLDLDLMLAWNGRNPFGHDGQEQHLLMQHLIDRKFWTKAGAVTSGYWVMKTACPGTLTG